MEKIVVVSREPENHEQLIALIRTVFPECPVEFMATTDDGLPCKRTSIKKGSNLYGEETHPPGRPDSIANTSGLNPASRKILSNYG